MAGGKTQPGLESTQNQLSGLEGTLQSIQQTVADLRATPHGQAQRVIADIGKGAQVPQYSGPFKRFGQFLKAVREVGHKPVSEHPLIKEYVQGYDTWKKSLSGWQQEYYAKASPSGLNETIGADGGFLIPPQFIQQLLQRAYDNDLLSRTTLFPMTSNQLTIPAIDETSRVDGSRFGGVQGYWRGEAQSVTASKPQLARVTLNLSPLTILVRVTDELIEDAGPALETFVDTVASQELTFKIGDAIINGTGVEQPLGILNSPALISVAKDTGQAAATLSTSNIVNMWSRMWIGSRSNAVWLINQDVEPQLYTLTLGVGTGGAVTFMPPGGLSGSPYATLMGRPVIPTEFNATLGTKGDIMLVDLGAVISGTKGGMQSAVSMHIYFDTSEQLFRFTFRLDARLWWLAALTPKNGTNTKSPVVALSTRS